MGNLASLIASFKAPSLKKLKKGSVPQHVAIIMDGNGRWAGIRSLPRTAGHRAGIEPIKAAVELCIDLGISVLTLYMFSAENWNRPAKEVKSLMDLLLGQLRKQTPDLHENNVQMRFMGDLDRLPEEVRDEIDRSRKLTENNTGLVFNLAISYGGRQEIIRAVKSVIADVNAGKLKADDISEDVFPQYLYTDGLPDPDLLIRTGNEMRISNFLLWQSAYTEIYVTDIFWPDFRKKDFLLALASYQKRERRFGRV